MFHKTLAVKFNEFIPYFWVFMFGIEREIPLLRKYRIFFSLYVFHIKLGLSLYNNMLFIILLICFLKFNFQSIVISRSIRDETDSVVISLICNVCESVFPKIIN